MALPSITLRNTKGSALTHTEMDTNLTNLQSANITVTANGTTSNIQLGSGFILSAGANIGLTNTAGNITITNTMPAGGSGITDLVSDLTPQLGGDLDPNDHYYTAANIYSGHRFTLTGVSGSLEYSALSQGLTLTAPTDAKAGIKIVQNVLNGAANDGSGTGSDGGPGLTITNSKTTGSAEASILLNGGNGSYGEFGFFKGVTAGYNHPYASTMLPGDGGMYVFGGDFHITPFNLDFGEMNPFVPGSVRFTALLEANSIFEFDLASGDLNVNKNNVVFQDNKGITSTGALNVTSASNGNINITPNGTGQINSSSHINISGLDNTSGPGMKEGMNIIGSPTNTQVGMNIIHNGHGDFAMAHMQLIANIGGGNQGYLELAKTCADWTGSGAVTSWKPGDAGFLNFGNDMRIGCSNLTGGTQGNVIFGTHADGADTVTFDLSTGHSDVILHSGNLKLATNKSITSAGILNVTSASNGNINITPNGTGRTVITNATLDSPAITNITSVNKVTITAPATSATLTILDGKTLTTNNTITLAGTDATVMTFPSVSANIGYMNMPQVINNSSATFALSDQGKHYFTNTGGQTFTIPANSVVPYPIGTVITIVNQSTSNVTVSGGGTSFYLAGSSSSKSTTTITTYGVATILKTGTDMWFINGTGVV